MSEIVSANSLHDNHNEKCNTDTKKYEGMVKQLYNKVLTLNKENHSLKSKLHSANNMIRILTSNREFDCDFTKADHLLSTTATKNNCSDGTAKTNCLNAPKKVDSAKNVRFNMRDQNKPVLQPRNVLNTQKNQVTRPVSNIVKTQNPKVKPVASTSTKIGVKPLATQTKIPVFVNPSRRNLEFKNKENAPPKNTTVASKKTELTGMKSGVKKSKGNTLLKKSVTEERPKIVKKNSESKMISMNKTFVVNH